MKYKVKHAIEALNAKMNVLEGERNIADIGLSGLFDKKEASAMITGLMGGKGALADNTDLDTVKYGGAYYLPKGQTFLHHPFESNANIVDALPAQLEIIRNFGADPRTTNPLIFQRWTTISRKENQIAYRSFYGGSWSPWSFPFGKLLWRGSTLTDGSKIVLADSVDQFAAIEMFWQPNGLPTRSSKFTSPQTVLTVSARNQPNDMSGTSPALSFEEVNASIAADGVTITAESNVYYIGASGVTASKENAGKSKIIAIKGYTTM